MKALIIISMCIHATLVLHLSIFHISHQKAKSLSRSTSKFTRTFQIKCNFHSTIPWSLSSIHCDFSFPALVSACAWHTHFVLNGGSLTGILLLSLFSPIAEARSVQSKCRKVIEALAALGGAVQGVIITCGWLHLWSLTRILSSRVPITSSHNSILFAERLSRPTSSRSSRGRSSALRTPTCSHAKSWRSNLIWVNRGCRCGFRWASSHNNCPPGGPNSSSALLFHRTDVRNGENESRHAKPAT